MSTTQPHPTDEALLKELENFYFQNNGKDWSINEYKSFLLSALTRVMEDERKQVGRELEKKIDAQGRHQCEQTNGHEYVDTCCLFRYAHRLQRNQPKS